MEHWPEPVQRRYLTAAREALPFAEKLARDAEVAWREQALQPRSWLPPAQVQFDRHLDAAGRAHRLRWAILRLEAALGANHDAE
jgi:hypothetical protein